MFEVGGFFGTRADVLVDAVLLAFWILPFLLLFSFRHAKNMAFGVHKKIQLAAFILVAGMVILLEVDIRFFSLTDAIKKSIFYGNVVFNIILAIHIIVAVAALLGWAFLAIKSLKEFQKGLPGAFSKYHKKAGIAVFLGLCFTALSGSLIYVMLFVF